MHHKQSEMKERVVTRSSLTTDQQHPQRATETGHPPSWINNNLDTDLAKKVISKALVKLLQFSLQTLLVIMFCVANSSPA